MCLGIKSRSPTTRKFPEKVVRWMTGNNTRSNPSQLRIVNIPPLPMFLQLNDIVLLSIITHNEMGTSKHRPTQDTEIGGWKSEIFKLRKTRTEKARSEFVFTNCRLVNRLDDYIDFTNRQVLKNRLLNWCGTLSLKTIQNQTCVFGSSSATAPGAACQKGTRKSLLESNVIPFT